MLRLGILVLMLFSLVLGRCGGASFNGGKETKKEQPTPQPARARDNSTPPAVVVTPAPLPSVAPTVVPGAIAQGSFTVWTVPQNPDPKMHYDIYIEVKLPANISSYAYDDLSGSVVGTDSYQRAIGPN